MYLTQNNVNIHKPSDYATLNTWWTEQFITISAPVLPSLFFAISTNISNWPDIGKVSWQLQLIWKLIQLAPLELTITLLTTVNTDANNTSYIVRDCVKYYIITSWWPVGVAEWVERPPPILGDRGIRRSRVWVQSPWIRNLIKSNQRL